jgi:hypothetical protein
MSATPRSLRDEDPLSPRVLGALVVSLLTHLAVLGLVQVGNELHWWDARPFSIFRKVRITPEELARMREQQRRLEEQRQAEQPLLFVQVTQPSEEPPPAPKHYSSLSSRAANPETGQENQARIDGTQTRSIRTESAPQVATGRPTPPPQPEEPGPADASPPIPPAPTPPPPVETVARPVAPRLIEKAAEPARPAGLGELALARPEVRMPEEPKPSPPPEAKPEPEPEPPVETAVVSAPTPPVAPVTAPPPTPAPRARPRTVAEAKIRQALLAGEKMQQEGGVARKGPVQLDVKGVPFGAYDEMLIAAVQNRWFGLLEERRFAGGTIGRVVVTFKLHSDGSVRIVEPTESSVDPLMTGLCVRAIRDPSPYEKWPSDMLRMIGAPSREMRFTFFYN